MASEDGCLDAQAEEEGEEMIHEVFSWVRHGHIDKVVALLDGGFDVDERDDKGNTLLCVACQNGHKKMAKLCLRHGAEMGTRNCKGNTPLHFCHLYGFAPLAEYLISKGAEEATNFCGLLPSEMRDYSAAEHQAMEEAAPFVEVDQLATMSHAMLTAMMTQAGQARAMRTQAGGGAGRGATGHEGGGAARSEDADPAAAVPPPMSELSREEKHRRIRAKANAIRFGAPPPRRK